MADQSATKVTEAAKDAVTQAAAKAPAAATAAEPKAAAPVSAKAEPAKTEATKTEAAKAPAAKAAEAKAPVKRSARKTEVKRSKAKPARKPRVAAKSKPTARPATQTRKPARAGANRNEGVVIMNKQTKQNVEAGLIAADQFKTVFGDVNERAKAAAERSAKVAEELAEMTRGNVEAMVASSKIAAKGVEALSQDAAEYGRKAFEEASATLKSFAEVKSPTDFFKLQGDYARAAFDSAVAESARLSETVLKLAGDVAEPITSRYTVAAERVKTLAA